MKHFAHFLLSGLLVTSLASCSDSKKTDPVAPKEYEVEYRISSTTVTKSDFVLYTNETGGQTQLSGVSLPVSYKFKRTMKLGDATSILASVSSGNASSDITATILLDGQEKKKETGRGQNAQANTVFIIGQ